MKIWKLPRILRLKVSKTSETAQNTDVGEVGERESRSSNTHQRSRPVTEDVRNSNEQGYGRKSGTDTHTDGRGRYPESSPPPSSLDALQSNFKSVMLILKEVGELAANLPYLKGIAGAALQLVKIKEDIEACKTKRDRVQAHIDQLQIIVHAQEGLLLSEDLKKSLQNFARDIDHCWTRLEHQKAVKVVDRLLNAVYRIELLAAIDQCDRTVSQALSYLTLKVLVSNNHGIYTLMQAQAPTETSVTSHFKTIHRGDYEIIRPFSETIIPSAVRRPVMIQAASRKAAKRKRQFDMQPMVSESEQHQAVTVTTDWVSRIKGIDGERLIRVYEGKDRVKAMLKDLDIYHKLMNPHILQVYGISLEPTALMLHGESLRPWKDYIKSLTSSQDMLIAHIRLLSDYVRVGEYLRAQRIIGGFLTRFTPVNTTTGQFRLANFYGYWHGNAGTPYTAPMAWSTLRQLSSGAVGSGSLDILIPSMGPQVNSILSALTHIFTFDRVSNSASLTSMAKRNLLHDFYTLMACLKGGNKYGFHETSTIRINPTKGPSATYSIPYTLGKIHGITVSTAENVIRYISGCIPLLARGPWSGKIRWESEMLDHVVGPGWLRFQMSSPSDLPISATLHGSPQYSIDYSSWLSQIHYLIAKHGKPELLDQLTIVEPPIHIQIGQFKWQNITERAFLLMDTFMCDDEELGKPEKLYLFFRDLELEKNGCMTLPEIYWSPDSEGRERWGTDQLQNYLEEWGYELPDADIHIQGSTAAWQRFHYDVLADVHKACGFNPESDEVAKFLDLPLIEPLKLSEEQLPRYNDFIPTAYISPPSAPSLQSSDADVDRSHQGLALGDSIMLF